MMYTRREQKSVNFLTDLAHQYAQESGQDPDLITQRTLDIYNASGKPIIKQTPSLGARIIGLEDGRAHMSPFGKRKLYDVDNYEEFLAEVSHAFTQKNLGLFGHGKHGLIKGLFGKYGENYITPGYSEHTTHSITEPLLKSYVDGQSQNLASMPQYIKQLYKSGATGVDLNSNNSYTNNSYASNTQIIHSPNATEEDNLGKVVVRHPYSTYSKLGGLINKIRK